MLSVIVPTFDRPDSLKRAVESLFAQTYAATGFDLIIVDNTPSATASAMISTLRKQCPKTIRLIALHEPKAGVANARNAAMAAARSTLVAFLDDDQSAPSDWLEHLLDNYAHYPAAVTFGPVKTALPREQTRHRGYFEAFFARDPDLESGFIDVSFGCGNALIDFAQIPGGAPWFDVRMNQSGGEDDLLFRRVATAGGAFAWAQDAPVLEHPPQERVRLRYTLQRAFSYGQAPITMAVRRERKRWDLVAFWMLIGAGKAVWHGLQWILLSLIRHPARPYQLDRAIRGASKLVWWVDLQFYGAGALAKQTVKETPARPNASVAEAEQA